MHSPVMVWIWNCTNSCVWIPSCQLLVILLVIFSWFIVSESKNRSRKMGRSIQFDKKRSMTYIYVIDKASERGCKLKEISTIKKKAQTLLCWSGSFSSGEGRAPIRGDKTSHWPLWASHIRVRKVSVTILDSDYQGKLFVLQWRQERFYLDSTGDPIGCLLVLSHPAIKVNDKLQLNSARMISVSDLWWTHGSFSQAYN